MTVIGITIRIKYDTAVKNRGNAMDLVFHCPVPDFQAPAILFLPVLIQINQDIDASGEMKLFVDPKIRMDRKFSAIKDFMKAPAIKVGIRQQALNCSEAF